jgi:hypothetical protein
MTEEEIEKFNAQEEAIAKLADSRTNNILNAIIDDCSEMELNGLCEILKSGNQKEIDILIDGLVDMYG